VPALIPSLREPPGNLEGDGGAPARLLSRRLVVPLVTAALGMTSLNLALPILPLEVDAATHARAAAGIVTALVSVATIALELRSAALLRRFGQKQLLLAALLVQGAAMVGFATVALLPAMLLFGALAGAGFGVVATVTAATVGGLAPP